MTKSRRPPDRSTSLAALRSSAASDLTRGKRGVNAGVVYDESATMKAWERFLTAGGTERSTALARTVIERSWQRSAKSGVDARGRGSNLTASPGELYELRSRNRELLAAAGHTLRRLGELLGDAATMVLVTDRFGVILETGGDVRTIESGRDIRLEAGASWGESVTGTNGIGTALETGEPVYVHAAEHFCEGVKAWTCVGAPIRCPVDGAVTGILDFSGPQDIFHRHNVALAMVAASQIELALAEQARNERMRLLEACLCKFRTSGDGDGLVILDRFGRIVFHNEKAPDRWRSLDQSSELRAGRHIVDFGNGVDPLGHLPESLRGQSLEPLVIDGEFAGAVLILGPRPAPESATRAAVASRAVRHVAGNAVEAARRAIVGNSEALTAAVEKAERAAHGRASILLEGETGVGKELFARLIHAAGRGTGKEPFVAFNCGAISKDLLGGELFGHGAGAFTGATRDGRPGRFEVANGGVLSLDEIGEMPLDLQPYLLRVLEERMVYRLGESKPRPIDVRLIASTNRNLRQEATEGRFRKDLYFRIGAFKITIPPLRERIGDFDLLIDYFNAQVAATSGTEPLRFSDSVLDLLRNYSWPGNVRELRNLVENVALMATGRMIDIGDLPEDFIRDSAEPSVTATKPRAGARSDDAAGEAIERLDQTERHVIEAAIAAFGGNLSLAAEKLGVSRSTIYRKLQHYRSEP